MLHPGPGLPALHLDCDKKEREENEHEVDKGKDWEKEEENPATVHIEDIFVDPAQINLQHLIPSFSHEMFISSDTKS